MDIVNKSPDVVVVVVVVAVVVVVFVVVVVVVVVVVAGGVVVVVFVVSFVQEARKHRRMWKFSKQLRARLVRSSNPAIYIGKLPPLRMQSSPPRMITFFGFGDSNL